MRKVISLIMSLLMCFSLSVTASAQAVTMSVAQPYYEKADDASSELYLSGTTAECESYVNGNSDVVKIVAEQYLQKQGFLWTWSTYDGAEWTKTSYSNTLSMSNTKTGLTSGNYRLKTIFTLTDKYGGEESITVYSDERSVS